MSNSAANLINALATLAQAITAFQGEIADFEVKPHPVRNGQAREFGAGIEPPNRIQWKAGSDPQAAAEARAARGRGPAVGTPEFGPEHPPRTGPELYAWASRSDEARGTNLVGNLVAWGKRHQCPGRITGWDDEAVAAAFAAVCPRPSN